MTPGFYIPVPTGAEDAFLREKVSGIPFFLVNAYKLSLDYGRENIHVISEGNDIREVAEAHGFHAIEKRISGYLDLRLPGDLNVIISPYHPFLSLEQIKNLLNHTKEGDKVAILLPQHCTGTVYADPFFPAAVGGEIPEKTPEKTAILLKSLNAFESISVHAAADLVVLKELGLFIPGKAMPLLPGKILHPHEIKLLVLDIDGVLTDGGMILTENGDEIKKFNTKDGLGIKKIQEQGIPVAFLSSGYKKGIVQQRADMLGVKYVHVWTNPKMDVLKQWVKELGITLEEVAYVGDDLNDLEIFKSPAFCACPSDAVPLIQKHARVILSSNGGQGCVREFIDTFLLPFNA